MKFVKSRNFEVTPNLDKHVEWVTFPKEFEEFEDIEVQMFRDGHGHPLVNIVDTVYDACDGKAYHSVMVGEHGVMSVFCITYRGEWITKREWLAPLSNQGDYGPEWPIIMEMFEEEELGGAN